MTATISLLCPSRRRPEELAAMVRSAADTAADPDQVEIVVRLDLDDPTQRHAADAALNSGLYGRVQVGPTVILSEAWNECWRDARGVIYGHLGDDVRFESDGWDQLLIDTFDGRPDNYWVVHGDDCSPQGATFGTHCFVHRDWTDVVGRFCPPYFWADWNDTWFNDVANALGRRIYLDTLKMRHRHPYFGYPTDDTYRLADGRRAAENLPGMYFALEPERADDVAKLTAAIEAA